MQRPARPAGDDGAGTIHILQHYGLQACSQAPGSRHASNKLRSTESQIKSLKRCNFACNFSIVFLGYLSFACVVSFSGKLKARDVIKLISTSAMAVGAALTAAAGLIPGGKVGMAIKIGMGLICAAVWTSGPGADDAR